MLIAVGEVERSALDAHAGGVAADDPRQGPRLWDESGEPLPVSNRADELTPFGYPERRQLESLTRLTSRALELARAGADPREHEPVARLR